MKYIFILLVLPTLCLGQFQSQNTTNTADYTEVKKSYRSIKGNPYLFKEWVKADLIHLEKEKVEGAMIRLDLNKNTLEVKESKSKGLIFFDQDLIAIDDEKFLVLDDNYYKKIIIRKEDNPKIFKGFDVDSIFLMKGIHRDYLTKYAIVLFDGEEVQLIKTIEVAFRETKINSPGKIEKIKKFFRKTGYALIIDKEKTKVKLKDKDFYKVIGKQDQLKKYSKSNKLKLKKESDFVKLLEYWESLN